MLKQIITFFNIISILKNITMRMSKNFFWILFIVSTSLDGCGDRTINGSGLVTEKKIENKGFHTIKIAGTYNVILKKDSTETILVRADENLINNLDITNSDSILNISNKKAVLRYKELSFIITCPQLKKLDLSGAAQISCDTVLDFDNLLINISGAGNIKLMVQANVIETNVSGGADMSFGGKCNTFDISITGTGTIDAKNMEVDNCHIDISGFGKSILNVSEKLDISVTGYGKIKYVGEPEINQSVSGGASVERIY